MPYPPPPPGSGWLYTDGVRSQLDALVHIDAEDIDYVYDWRLQQEHELKVKKGSGMSNDAVRRFVDACTFPSPFLSAIADELQICRGMNCILRR
jgi:pantothenate kinase-related protein Tda10